MSRPGSFTWAFKDANNHGWRLIAKENQIVVQAIQWRQQTAKNNVPSCTFGIVRFKQRMTLGQVKQLVLDERTEWTKYKGKISREQNHPGLHDQRLDTLNQEGDFHPALRPLCTQCGKPAKQTELIQHYGICLVCYNKNMADLETDDKEYVAIPTTSFTNLPVVSSM